MTKFADAIFFNARLYTVNPAQPWADALAVKSGRILDVGHAADLRRLQGPETRMTDLAGRMVMPGLGDVHNHHMRGGELDMFELNFPATATFDDILALVRAQAERIGPDDWISGGIWGSVLGPRLTEPASLRALDEASLGRPVSLIDEALHNRWVNSRAMALAGITCDTPDPKDGHIHRHTDGNPSGLLIEKAMALATRAAAKAIADPKARSTAACQRAIEILNSYGVTFFQDAATTLGMMEALQGLDQAAALTAWVVCSLPAYDTLNGTDLFGPALIERRGEFRSRHLHPNFVKFFNDGVPMTHTAAMLDAYLPDETGKSVVCQPFHTTPELVRWIKKAAGYGMGIKVHCAGDSAVRATLDAIEVVRDSDGPGPMHQIAHAGYVHPDDIARFARLNVLADLCPALWVPSPILQAIMAVLPAERAARYWPLRDMKDAGVLMAAGSDWPVIGLPDPWYGMEGMVTRTNPRQPHLGAMWPEQALTLGEVIEVYTINVAKGMGLAHETGSISPGKSADFIVLDQHLFDIPAQKISKTTVLQTWFEGRLVHER